MGENLFTGRTLFFAVLPVAVLLIIKILFYNYFDEMYIFILGPVIIALMSSFNDAFSTINLSMFSTMLTPLKSAIRSLFTIERSLIMFKPSIPTGLYFVLDVANDFLGPIMLFSQGSSGYRAAGNLPILNPETPAPAPAPAPTPGQVSLSNPFGYTERYNDMYHHYRWQLPKTQRN